MNKRLRVAFFMTITLLLVGNVHHAFAQITITGADLLSLAGKQETVLLEEEGNYTFNSGSSGGNQVWDFRNNNFISPTTSIHKYYSPQGTVHANVFPAANLVHEFVIPDSLDGEFYNFYTINSNFFVELGDSIYFGGDLDTSIVSMTNDTVAAFPLQFGDTWQTASADTQSIVPGFFTIDTDTSMNTIDAWGTVRLPMGDFECLRLRIDDKTTNTTVANGIVVSSSSESTIQYRWLAKGAFELAWVQSQPGETNPNFTDAWGWGRLDAVEAITGIEESAAVPEEIDLLQNYPNPFNPETTIAFELPRSAQVKLDIYSILGQKVRTLVEGSRSAGHHNVAWDARDQFGKQVAGGYYIYRLQVGNTVQTKKMLFLK
ncbi:MAG: T9SS C-terminal target domain-containing protein [Calditrichaeota bacterium]|nr:MAG: T9SS C-terminal target domain-containing protein [Calditrichota bacterium]